MYYFEGLDFGMTKRRGVFTVAYEHGFHIRQSIILFKRLRVEVPKVGSRVRVLGFHGELGRWVDGQNMGQLLLLTAKPGAHIVVQVQADTQADAIKAIAIAREVIEAPDESLPPHFELADVVAERLPGVCKDSELDKWLRSPSQRAGVTRHKRRYVGVLRGDDGPLSVFFGHHVGQYPLSRGQSFAVWGGVPN